MAVISRISGTAGFAVGVWSDAESRNVGIASAGVAFYALLAVFPGIAAVISLWGFLSDPAVIDAQIELLREFLPPDAFTLIVGQTERLMAARDTTLGWTTLVSIAVTLWSARLGVGALLIGLNSVHGVPNRGGFGHAVVAVALTLALVGVVLVALAAFVILPVVLAFLPLGNLGAAALTLANWLVALAVVAGGVALVFRLGPNRAEPLARLWPGLVVAVALWGVVSVAFARYLAAFGNYNEVYGSLGAVVALLMWFYIGAYALLLGAVLNVKLAERTQ